MRLKLSRSRKKHEAGTGQEGEVGGGEGGGGEAGSGGTVITLALCLIETACRLAGLHNRVLVSLCSICLEPEGAAFCTGGSRRDAARGGRGGRAQPLPVSLGRPDSSERLEDYIWNPVR